jgi:hypothetical protein
MNAPLDRTAFEDARILAEPPAAGRVFDLHPALHAAVFGGFAAYLGIMWAAFGTAQLILPFAIFFVFLAGAWITPAMWARVAGTPGRKTSWSEFLRDGFECGTGHVTAGAAMGQVLIMPAMLLLWGLAVAVIKASV